MLKLDLREIPVYYINLDSAVDSRKSMEEMMKNLGFENVTRVSAIKHPGGNKGGCSASHHLVMSLYKPPFIVLEDDCVVNEFIPEVEIPEDSDAFYLGISSWGRKDGISGPHVHWEKVGKSNLLRVYNMLGTHAILYLSYKYASACKDIAEAQHQKNDYIDIGYSEVHSNYNIYTFNNPMFYQSSSQGTDKPLLSYPTTFRK